MQQFCKKVVVVVVGCSHVQCILPKIFVRRKYLFLYRINFLSLCLCIYLISRSLYIFTSSFCLYSISLSLYNLFVFTQYLSLFAIFLSLLNISLSLKSFCLDSMYFTLSLKSFCLDSMYFTLSLYLSLLFFSLKSVHLLSLHITFTFSSPINISF